MPLVYRIACLLIPALSLLAVPAPGRAEDDDRATLLAAYRRATTLEKQGQSTAAVREYEKALALADRVYGADDLNTANLAASLAKLYKALGHHAKAEPLYLRNLRIREARL